MSKQAYWVGLIFFVGICLGTGALGAIATTPEIDTWYKTLAKPPWTPPDYLFGPVWTTLYVLMGIAAWFVWKPAGFWKARLPLTLFAAQLCLNLFWSWLFFRFHLIGWALLDISLLWVVLIATTVTFFRNSQWAGWPMVAYLVWVSFALGLNFAIWRLNL